MPSISNEASVVADAQSGAVPSREAFISFVVGVLTKDRETPLHHQCVDGAPGTFRGGFNTATGIVRTDRERDAAQSVRRVFEKNPDSGEWLPIVKFVEFTGPIAKDVTPFADANVTTATIVDGEFQPPISDQVFMGLIDTTNKILGAHRLDTFATPTPQVTTS